MLDSNVPVEGPDNHAGARRRNVGTATWIVAVLLAFIAGMLMTNRPQGVAFAQNAAAGARGVFAFPAQIDRDRWGMFMVDVDQGTLWCYELEPSDGTRRLKLVAARTWVYDRYLQDFNSAAPDFRAVQQLVADQRNLNLRPPGGVAENEGE